MYSIEDWDYTQDQNFTYSHSRGVLQEFEECYKEDLTTAEWDEDLFLFNDL